MSSKAAVCTQIHAPQQQLLPCLSLVPRLSAHRGTLILGFEQATKYTVLDQDGNTVRVLELQGLLAHWLLYTGTLVALHTCTLA